MHTIFRIAAALALTGASLPALGASATATRSWQFKPGANAGLTVRNLIGNVRVERGTTPGIHMTASTAIDAASQAEADRLIKLVEFRTSDAAAGSRFDVRLPREHFPKIYWEKGASAWYSLSYVEHLGERIRLSGSRSEAPEVRVDLVIRAPAGATLAIHNRFGDASAEGYAGTLRLEGGSGQLTSTGGEGEVTLDNGSGAVVVSRHRGRVVADTGSGSVRISDCQCEIIADTGSGSVDIVRGSGSVSSRTPGARSRSAEISSGRKRPSPMSLMWMRKVRCAAAGSRRRRSRPIFATRGRPVGSWRTPPGSCGASTCW